MQSARPIARDLVLLGGGHAHVHVLKRFAMRPDPGTRLTIISKDLLTPYSGMIPGYLAGHYHLHEAHIDLNPLARLAQARLYQDTAIGLDLARRQVFCAARPPVAFDFLSIDIGSTPPEAAIEGADNFALGIKPIDRFLQRWQRLQEQLLATGQGRICIVGGGAGGVEVAMALRHRLRQAAQTVGRNPDHFTVSLITDRPTILSAQSARIGQAVSAALQARQIEVITDDAVSEIAEDYLLCRSGRRIETKQAVLVTGAAAPAWLQQTGLPLDKDGFIRITDDLGVEGHKNIFAAGDIASFQTATLPKSGVYAVRQGPVLALNLRRSLQGQATRPYRPQPRSLALISTGDRQAIAAYGGLAWSGRWPWRVKDWIDRRWMRRYQQLPAMRETEEKDAEAAALAMRCGGCGAKVASNVLREVLARLSESDYAAAFAQLDASDDAARPDLPAGAQMAQSVDQFRSFLDDPFLFGEIAAQHCLNDLYAMGAAPHSALAAVTLPYAAADKIAEQLYQLLCGVGKALAAAGAHLIGGHTGEGAELSLGLTVNGLLPPSSGFLKAGLKAGDALILTKPLGTGTVFAADMRGQAGSEAVTTAIAGMRHSNREAAALLQQFGCQAATDITGFGLAGHALEMANASNLGLALNLDSLTAYPGAEAFLQAGLVSSLQAANLAFADAIEAADSLRQHRRYALLFDPQTAGGLLAGIATDSARPCLAALQAAGYQHAAIIGRADAQLPTGAIRLTASR